MKALSYLNHVGRRIFLRAAVLVTLSGAVCLTARGQSDGPATGTGDRYAFSVTGGYIFAGLLSESKGWQIGLNSRRDLSRYFSLEAQLSFSRFRTFGGSHTDTHHMLAGLVGGRLYVSSPERPVRPYVQMLVGAAHDWSRIFYSNDEIYHNSDTGLALSGGVYLELGKRFHVGLSSLWSNAEAVILVGAGYTF